MKIFSNKLYFFFFSLLFCLSIFIGNVKATTKFTTKQFPLVNSYMQTTGKTIGDFRKFVLENTYNITSEFEYENYIVLLGYSNNTKGFALYYLNAEEFNIGKNSDALYFRDKNLNSKYGRINYEFNSTYTAINQINNIIWIKNYKHLYFASRNENVIYMVLSSNLNEIKYTNPTWDNDSFLIDNYETSFNNNMNLVALNQNYNLPVIDYFSNPIPIIQPPYNTYHNGYTETTFIVDNYTLKSVSNGYNVEIINNNNGNTQFIAPLPDEPYQEVDLKSYENTNYTFQVYDREHNIIQEYSINANVDYEVNTNFSVEITNIDNNTKEVFYKYIISDYTQNYTCYHSINNNEFIQDLDCTDTSTVYYNLTMPNNGNLAFKIEDNNGNIVYEYNQNFVFSVSDTYISFKDNFENNYLNLNVLINRYQSNDIVEYSINNSSFIQANLQDYSTTQNIKNFYVNNLNNNDILVVRVKRNNEIITYATYKANYLKNNTSSSSNFNLNNFFDKLNINNINLNLRNYITQIGNIFINSKLGNLIILEFFIMVVCWVLKTIRK